MAQGGGGAVREIHTLGEDPDHEIIERARQIGPFTAQSLKTGSG